jgi:hypothetical protein
MFFQVGFSLARILLHIRFYLGTITFSNQRLSAAGTLPFYVKELLPKIRTANIDRIYFEKEQIAGYYLRACNTQVIHPKKGLSTENWPFTHNLKYFSTLSQSLYTHPVQKKIPSEIWVQWPKAKMQQQRSFTRILIFFYRGTSHSTAILHRCVAHFYACKGFSHRLPRNARGYWCKHLAYLKNRLK